MSESGDATIHARSFAELFQKSDHKQDLCVLAVLTWIAACDGTIDTSEKELLRRIAESNDEAAELPAVVEIILLRRPADLEVACRFLRTNTSRGDKRLLARLAVTMAVQNGHLTLYENFVLQFLADLLGISPRAFARLFEQIARRPFPIPGDPSDPEWWRRGETGEVAGAGPDAWDSLAAPRRRWRRGRADPLTVPPPVTDDGDEEEPMTRAEAIRLLGLENGATADKAHAAYRRLAKKRHPDRFAPLGNAAVATATFAFERLNRAYALLSR